VKNILCQIDANCSRFFFGMGHAGSPNIEIENIMAQRLFSEAEQEQD
jgi:hypothetical protein